MRQVFLMKTKYSTVIVAVVMVAFAGAFIIAPVDDADASGTIGSYNFYLTTDLSTFVKYESTGINASDALNSKTDLLSAMDSTVDNAFSKQYHNEYGDYTSVNTTWGAITKNAGSAVSGHQWNVFVYTLDGSNGAGQWKVADKTLGFYKPFDDYNSAYATANVALYYGVATTAPTTLPVTGLQSLTPVTETATYAVNFEFTYVNNGEDVYTTATGYGSDAALALINAVGSTNVSLVTTPGVNYGYLNSLYNLATVENSDGSWSWWYMMNNVLPSNESVESVFYLGMYTPITGYGELSSNLFTLYYS